MLDAGIGRRWAVTVPSLIRAAGVMQLSAKTAGVESAMRLVGLVGEDAATLAVRSMARAGDKVLAIPQMVDRVNRIDDPNAEATYSPKLAIVRRILRLTGKVASLHVPQAPETTARWELDSKRIGQAFNSTGPAFHSTMADQGTTGTGDFAKNGGEGNAQTTLMENGPRRVTATLASGGLDSRAASASAFDQLRAFMGSNNVTMNTQ